MYRATFKDLLKKEEVVIVKKEYRSLYKLNWRVFFRNLYTMIAFWKPKKYQYYQSAIIVNQAEDEIAIMRENNIKSGLEGRNTLQE